MTDTANKAHAGWFEGPVKRAITHCKLLANPEYSPIKRRPAFDFWYGVDYDVRGDGVRAFPNANTAYARAVNANLVCNARYVKEEKANPIRTFDLTDTEISDLHLPPLPGPDHTSPCL